MAFRRLPSLALGLAAAALLAPSAAGAATAKVGAVYTETNDPAGNQVVAFDRFSDGTLSETQRVSTGGVGEPYGHFCPLIPFGGTCDFTDSQGAVNLTSAGNLVFAVNAGSDTISSFRVGPQGGLTLVDQRSSRGDYPNSITTHGNLLYVLNQESGNIAGFRFDGTGHLFHIAGSDQPLVNSGDTADAAQVGFDRTGRILAVTERETSLIDTFVVTAGVAGPAIPNAASAGAPFGFAFDALRHLVVSHALFLDANGNPAGVASTYGETGGGTLTPIDLKSTDGIAPCWVVITPDNRYVYITNSGTKTIARMRLGTNGTLTLLGTTPIPNVNPGLDIHQFPTDEALSRDGRFLYVLIPGVSAPFMSRVDAFRIGPGGSLTFVGSTPENMPPGASGLAAR